MTMAQRKTGWRAPADGSEPIDGNYFVATYPPFSVWQPRHRTHVARVLAEPPTDGDAPSFGLYVHIPFCIKRCDYCYYLAYADCAPAQIDQYLAALVDELARYRHTAALATRHPSFVYFGGGTPSLPSARRLGRLLDQLQAIFAWSQAREVSFECAPRTVTAAKLRCLRDGGVTRVSLGVQQLDDDVLQRNGRVHLVGDVHRAYEAMRQVGFDVINLDLMVGMVGETDATFLKSVEQVIALQPESVTIYQLEIPHNTPLHRHMCDGTQHPAPATWEVKRARLAEGFRRLEGAGYSIRSAYAAVRHPVRHAFVYQDAQYGGANLLGIGAASFSYLNGVHWQNHAGLRPYLDSVRRGQTPVGRAHALSDEEQLVRRFVLRLKLGRADADEFRRDFGAEIAERFAPALSRAAAQGWLRCDDRGVTATRQGLLRIDRLIEAFYLPQHRGVPYT